MIPFFNQLSFTTGGDVGDTIYALKSISGFGKSHLILKPVNYVREQYSPSKLWNVAPLFSAQEYIRSVSYRDSSDAIDIDIFRKRWNGKSCLVDGIAECLGLVVNHEPWLKVNKNEVAPIVIHRSFDRILGGRYHTWTWDTWRRILNNIKSEKVFVGSPDEWEEFNKNIPIPYYRTGDLLKLAEVIHGAKLFIGNQSAPLAIRLGLGGKSLQEVFRRCPNCILKRDDVFWCDDENGIFEGDFICMNNLL